MLSLDYNNHIETFSVDIQPWKNLQLFLWLFIQMRITLLNFNQDIPATKLRKLN